MENTQTWGVTRGLTFEDVWVALMETDRKIRETDQKIRKRLSDLGRYGKMIDGGFIPRIEKEFNALGFVFERSAEKALFGSREHYVYAEIDVFLENRDSAVAVAVKGRPWDGPEQAEAAMDDIWEQVERMEKLGRYFELRNDRRKLYGAVAAGIFPEKVLSFAMEQGLYVIEYRDEQVKIRIPGAMSNGVRMNNE
jgi:hypothetical protein